MKRTPQTNYLTQGWRSALLLIAILVAVSLVPPQSIGGVALRRANILSDLWSPNDSHHTVAQAEPVLFNEEEFHVDFDEVQNIISADTVAPQSVETTYLWQIDGFEPERRLPDVATLGQQPRNVALTPIEAADSASMPLVAFCDTLLTARRTVRIAVLGDSFVEGDILTADLRERLQESYGGGGAGFAPVASPLTSFRRTIKTQSKGWTSYNIMQRKSTPESLRQNFYVSGWVCSPEADAQTRWEMTDYRDHLGDCTTAHLLFISPRDSRVEIALNDTLRREFTIEGDAAVRRILVQAPRITSLAMRLSGRSDGFTGYGAIFEEQGITVDNYSVRSNNGQAMFWTNPAVNAQINAMLGYDLVILQYGLNIMQAGVTNYTSYGAQIEKMVAYVRECFPGAEVLVMGVSDRSVKGDKGFEPMDAIPHMLRYQRQAAHRAGAAFWSTCDAMRALGGMAAFVQNGWAGKDYTHINYAGGRRIAHALADAIDDAVRQSLERRRALQREQQIIDSLQRAEIERQILSPVENHPIKTE